MKHFLRFLAVAACAFSPLAASAFNRNIGIDNPGSVVTGSSFNIRTFASTDAWDGEQIGFFHAQVSTDGGSNWSWYTSDVDLGGSASRWASGTAGAVGSTIVIRVRIAFRHGGAGDVAYDGSAIDWGSSWDNWNDPPARYFYIPVVAPPNSAPSVSMTVNGVGNGGSFSSNIGNSLTIALSASDPESNLRAINLWVATPNTSWRNIRSDNSIMAGFAENTSTDNAVSSGGANVGSLSGTRYFTVPLSEGFGNYTFVARSIDAYGATSGSHQVVVSVANRAPNTPTITATPSTITFGQSFVVSGTITDPDGNLYALGIMRYDGAYRRPNLDYSRTSWNGYSVESEGVWSSLSFTNDHASGGSTTKSGTYTPGRAGAHQFHVNGHDSHTWSPGAWTYPHVNKATPVWTTANQSFTGTHTVTQANLNAAFANLRNSLNAGVAQPTGAVSYAVTSASGAGASGTGAISPGSTTLLPGSYTVTATYAGDSNYNGTSASVTFTVNNRAPTASFTLNSTSREFGQTLTITPTVADADGNFAYSNLWVYSPVRGWLTIKADNSVVVSGSLSSANNSGGPGTYSRSLLLSQADGIGTYTVTVASVDSTGARTDAANQTVTVTRATPAGTFAHASKQPPTGAGYTVAAGDLNATFVNPHSGSVSAPSGAISYSIAPSSPNGTPGSAVTAGTVLPGGRTYVIRATIAASTYYNSTSVDSTWTVNKAAQPGVYVTSSVSATYGTSYTATAAGGSGTGAYVWSMGSGSTAAGAAINSSTGVVTALSAGTVVVRVYRAGDTGFNQSPTTADFTVTFAKRPVTVTLGGSRAYTGSTIFGGGLTYAPSGLAGGDTIASITTQSATAGTYTAPGSLVVRNGSSTDVTSSYTISYSGSYQITQAVQASVSITSSSFGYYGTSYTATVSGGSGTGAYEFALASGSTASAAAINSSTGAVTASSSGTVVFRARRTGDANHQTSAWSGDFTLALGARPITVTLSGSRAYDGTTSTAGAAASITSGSLAAGDSISYAIANPYSPTPGSYSGLVTATITNGTSPGVRTGSYAITHEGAYMIGQASQMISFSALENKTYGDAPFDVSATASSGLPVTFSIASGSATVSGNTVTILGAGTVVVRASQAGNAEYSAAPNVDRTFTVAPAGQTVAISPTAQTIYATQSVTFTASGGQNGYVWGGTGGATGSGSSKTVTFNANGTYTVTVQSPAGGNHLASNVASATIQVNPAYTLTLNADAGGSVSGAGLYPATVVANPTATANAGYVFAGWYGPDAGTMVNPYDASGSIVIDANKSLTARFVSIASVPTLGSIDFGHAAISTGVGHTRAIRDAIMSNVGNSPLEVRSMTIVSGSADFSVPATGGMVAAGDSLSAPVSFSPSGSTLGVRSGRIVVVTTDGTYPVLAYDLTATASTGSTPPAIDVSITSLASIFPGDSIFINVEASVTFGNVTHFTWSITGPDGVTAPATVLGPSPTLFSSIPYSPASIGGYTFNVTAYNDNGQESSDSISFTVIQGEYFRVLNARAEPSDGLNIWFTPSTTTSTPVNVWKAR